MPLCWDGEGGGIANEAGTLVITGSSVSGSAAWGGAVASIGGKVVVNDSEFTGQAIEYGGTWLLYGAHASMTGVTITGSRSLGSPVITGGPDGTLTIRDSELRDNWGPITNVSPGRLTLIDTVTSDNLGVLSGPLGDIGPGAFSRCLGQKEKKKKKKKKKKKIADGQRPVRPSCDHGRTKGAKTRDQLHQSSNVSPLPPATSRRTRGHWPVL